MSILTIPDDITLTDITLPKKECDIKYIDVLVWACRYPPTTIKEHEELIEGLKFLFKREIGVYEITTTEGLKKRTE